MQIKNILLFCCSFILLASCQKEFQVDNTNYKPKLVLNNLFQQNAPFEVVVSKSTNVYDTILPSYLSTATVKLYVNGAYTETLTSIGQGKYNATTLPTAGNTYKISVSNAGFDDAVAENKMPNPVKISNWAYIDSTFKDSNGDYFGDLTFTIDDPMEENNYLLSFQFWDVVTQSYLYLSLFESADQSLNQNLAKRLQNGEYLFTDNLFNGKKKNILLKIPSGYYDTTPNYLLKLYSLSKAAYFYAYTKPETIGNALNNTPIYSNVTNGLGIFAGRSLDVDTIR